VFRLTDDCLTVTIRTNIRTASEAVDIWVTDLVSVCGQATNNNCIFIPWNILVLWRILETRCLGSVVVRTSGSWLRDSELDSQSCSLGQLNSAFHPSWVGRSSTSLLAGVKAGAFTCVGAGNTVWSHMEVDASDSACGWHCALKHLFTCCLFIYLHLLFDAP